MEQEIYKDQFDYIEKNKDKLIVYTKSGLQLEQQGCTLSKEGFLVLPIEGDHEFILNQILLSYLGLSIEDIRYISENKSELQNMKNIIRYNKIKKELNELENIIY